MVLLQDKMAIQIIADIEAGALSLIQIPTLGGTLDGNGNNMVGIDNITANNVNALVYDTDIRAVSSSKLDLILKVSQAQVNNMVTLYLQPMLITALLQVKQVLVVTLVHSRATNGRLLE